MKESIDILVIQGRKANSWDHHLVGFVSLLHLDYRILWSAISLKRTDQNLFFFAGNNHQGKVASKTTNFGWVWSVVLVVQSKSRVFWSVISLEGISWYYFLIDVFLSLLFIFFYFLSNFPGVHVAKNCSVWKQSALLKHFKTLSCRGGF